jgi:hypothetical protein
MCRLLRAAAPKRVVEDSKERDMNTLARITLLLAASIAGAIGSAPGAVASPASDFCRSMANVGFTGDCATLTADAQYVCSQYDRGVNLDTIVQKLDLATKNENLSNYIVAGASLYFCPNHADRT